MRKSSTILFAGIVALAPGLSSPQASAQGSWLTVTQCEQLDVGGQEHPRITFEIHNVFGIAMNEFDLVPLSIPSPSDTCHVIQVVSPSGWSGTTTIDGGAYFYELSFPEIPPGGTVSGFQVVLTRPVCCYRFRFYNAIIDPFAERDVCFACPGTTPAGSSSWGALKSHYR